MFFPGDDAVTADGRGACLQSFDVVEAFLGAGAGAEAAAEGERGDAGDEDSEGEMVHGVHDTKVSGKCEVFVGVFWRACNHGASLVRCTL